jgi:hypothetical protein
MAIYVKLGKNLANFGYLGKTWQNLTTYVKLGKIWLNMVI